ncbi:MAG: hypothetical protein ACM359_15575 [Bacillota bacterium]
MGRGLSKLQLSILFLAERNWHCHPNQPHVYYAEILTVHFGWKPESPIGHDLRGRPGCHRFSKARIGAEKYAATMAVLSRAVGRLAQRGLVTRVRGTDSHWSAANLTCKGERFIARMLRDDTADRVSR